MTETNHRETYRRDLSGIYFFDTLPQDKGRRYPTCIEDCTEKKRMDCLLGRSPEWLKDCGQHLNETFQGVWKMLKKGEQKRVLKLTGGHIPHCETSLDEGTLPYEINSFCKMIRAVAGMAGIYAQGSEADLRKPKSETEG